MLEIKSALLLATAIFLSACNTYGPNLVDPSQPPSLRRLYGVVTNIEPVPFEAVLTGPACVKHDENCVQAIEEVKGLQFAAVSIYDAVAFTKVIVPANQQIAIGDIIEFQLDVDPRWPPVFTSFGSRFINKNENCDWIDGSLETKKGGVVCKGWTYTDILPKKSKF